jgi:hypothetical protein
MPARAIARPRLIDHVIIIAAIAVGLAVARAAEPGFRKQGYPATLCWIESTGPCVEVWMITILGLRLGRPRPQFWRLARQPGILACTLTLVSSTLFLIHSVSDVLSTVRRGDKVNWIWFWVDLAAGSGRGAANWIIAAWLTLALTGRWRPSRDWFDRAGIALGSYLLVMFWIVPLITRYSLMFF